MAVRWKGDKHSPNLWWFFTKMCLQTLTLLGWICRKCLEDVQNSKIMKVAPDEEQSLISSSSDPPGSFISLCNVTQSKDSSSGLLKR